MAGHLCCAQCGDMVNTLLPDPRNPPLDIGDCLCNDCCSSACDEAIGSLDERIVIIKKLQTKADK